MIAAAILAILILDVLSYRADSEREAKGYYILSAAVGALAQGIWISVDCRLMGRPIRRWPMAAVFCGPLGIWTYMIVSYRARAVFMILASIAVYAVAIFLPEVVIRLLEGDAESAL